MRFLANKIMFIYSNSRDIYQEICLKISWFSTEFPSVLHRIQCAAIVVSKIVLRNFCVGYKSQDPDLRGRHEFSNSEVDYRIYSLTRSCETSADSPWTEFVFF